MKERVYQFALAVWRSHALKYIAVLVFGVVIIGFGSDNSLWRHYQNKQRINELASEIDHYRGIHEANQAELRRLKNDPKTMHHTARERYFMKKDNEDVFVFREEE